MAIRSRAHPLNLSCQSWGFSKGRVHSSTRGVLPWGESLKTKAIILFAYLWMVPCLYLLLAFSPALASNCCRIMFYGWILIGVNQNCSPFILWSPQSKAWPTGDWWVDRATGEQKQLKKDRSVHLFPSRHTQRHIHKCTGACVCVCVMSVLYLVKRSVMESVYQIELSVRWWLIDERPAPFRHVASFREL